MRLQISHEIHYRYKAAPKRAIEVLRLTPQNHQGQFIVDWRLDVSSDGRLTRIDDGFGNIAHSVSIEGPIESFSVIASGEVATDDTAGVVREAVERLPVAVFLRDTDFTQPTPRIAELADRVLAGAVDRLDFLHRLNKALHERFETIENPPAPTRHAGEIEAGEDEASAQDLAHLFASTARRAGVPARFVCGYRRRDDVESVRSIHSWVEAHMDGIGWIAFDPSDGTCPTYDHVRLGVGLDWLGAAPIRGARTGGEGETLTQVIRVHSAGATASQSQAQWSR